MPAPKNKLLVQPEIKVLNQVLVSVYKMKKESDIKKVLISLRQALVELGLKFNGCSFQIIKPGQNKFDSYSIKPNKIIMLYQIPLKGTAVFRAWKNKQPIYRKNIQKLDQYHDKKNIRRIVSSVIDVPFSHGTIAINNLRPNAFSGEDIKILKMFADVISEGYARFIDLTNQKKFLNKVKEVKDEYKTLAESLSELIYRADPKTLETTYINKAVKIIYGYSVKSWLKNPKLWENTIYPKDKKRVLKKFLESRRALKNSTITYRIIKKNKTIRWVEDHYSWIKNQTGKVVSLNGMMYDITKRKQAEEELKKHRDQLKSLVQKRTNELTITNKKLKAKIIQREKAEQALQYRLSMEELVADISTAFINLPAEKIDMGINSALKKIGEFTGIGRSYVFLLSKDKTKIRNAHEWHKKGFGSSFIESKWLPCNVFPWAIKKLKKFETLSIPDINKLPAEAKKEKKLLQTNNVKSLISVPMVQAGYLVGFIGLNAVQKKIIWPKEDIILLKMIAQIFTNALSHKEKDKALKQSEQKYHSIFETAPDLITSVNNNGIIINCNKQIQKTLGYTKDEIINQPMAKIIHPDYLAQAQDSLKKILKQGYLYNREYKMVRKDKSVLDVNINSAGLKDDKGKYIKTICIIEDITERKKAEENLKKTHNKLREISELNKKILENVPVSIITLDKKGYITSANNYWTKLTGIPVSQTIGANFFKYNDASKNGLVKAFRKVLATRKKGYLYNDIYKSDIGQKKYYLDIKAAPLLNQKKDVTSLISIADDVTTLINTQKKLKDLNKKLEKKVDERTKKLKKAKEKLEKAINLKTRFLADASHELRTPITIIKGNLDIIKKLKKEKDKFPQEELNIISHEIDKISETLLDLTTLARADSGEVPMKRKKFQLNLLIKNIIQEIRGLAESKNIKIKHNLKSVVFWGDKDKLEKLILNLATNAIKYGKKNGWLKISLNFNKNNAKIIVEDNGIGIAKSDLPLIFERFYRVDKARSHDSISSLKGTGLGLAICKWAVNAHQGHIKVQSKLRKGTKFIVILPKISTKKV